jgi:hypothetical protein
MDDILIKGIVHPVGWNGDRLGTGVPWPVPLKRLATAIVALRQVLLNYVVGKPTDRAGNALRLAVYHFSVSAAAIAEVALAIDAERESGLVLAGVPEIDWLRGHAERIPDARDGRGGNDAQSGLRRLAGRMARAASWSSPWRWPQVLLFPSAVAVTHNDLLRGEAAQSSEAIGFRHADEWLASIRASAPAGGKNVAAQRELADAVAAEVSRAIGVDPKLEVRVAGLLAARLYGLLETAWRDITALENARLPNALWSGTGGNWAARALGIEVMRRGGLVRRFDHGCGFATVLDPQGAGLIEFCASTDFVAATPTLADMLRKQMGPECPVRIEGGRGDPHYRVSPGPIRVQRKRPRVMYVTGAILGFRRLWPVKASDFVYLDWQLRVARALRTLDVELTLKPHPEGLFRGHPHPLGRVGRIEMRRFEEAFDEADVVLFDEPTSTTFWVAVSSNCRIVLMNAGLAEFDPRLAPLVQSRVATVPVHWDAANRPQIDLAALEAAIRDERPIDYRPLRRLLAGEGDAIRH